MQKNTFMDCKPQQPLGEINQAEVDNKEKKGDKDIITQVKEILDQISVIDKGYFAKDKQKQIKQMMEECIKILDTKPIDLIQNKKNVLGGLRSCPWGRTPARQARALFLFRAFLNVLRPGY